MLFQISSGGLIGVTQPSHAWISGQIIRAWGNKEFGTVTPYEDVCLGAEQHDIGWLTWERSPTLNKMTGRPHSFRELSPAVHTGIWSAGTEMALALGRYPALLVSLHGTGLYGSFDAASASQADRDAVRDFMHDQQRVQSRLIDSLRHDPGLGQFASDDTIERNRRLVRAADRMSIAVCTGLRDLAIRSDNPFEAVVRDVPLASGATDLRLTAIGGDLATIAVSPWPFSVTSLRVRCEGFLLPTVLFEDQTDMRIALRDAKRVAVSAEFRSAM